MLSVIIKRIYVTGIYLQREEHTSLFFSRFNLAIKFNVTRYVLRSYGGISILILISN